MTISRGTIVPIKIPALERGPVFLSLNERRALVCMECLTKYVEENGMYPTEDEIRMWHSDGTVSIARFSW